MQLNTPSLLWFLTGVVLLLLELSMPSFVLFFFALGAWLTAGAAWLYEISLNTQILIFIVASLVSLLLLRRFVKKAFGGGKSSDGRSDHSLAEAGTKVVVVADIVPPSEGKIKYSGTTWRATASEKIEAGEIAEIVEQDGLLITVQRAGDAEL
ncbi:NfeD family protein [Desulfopila aestuarii]|uniref:Membrane protein implicated in regulation of membrane protease activity n=1 Tax=Desulfopila aestuarii DSM 18488 TaxID=1121416 RepID=A0A1M7Y6T4_9BACT|nr:NfeD family protein [Desulfopila aestuarii]SHO48339.1 Membrane protein implicated in regulation of membrane protease activity [Desulfopila aestuarii DSM 18488]